MSYDILQPTDTLLVNRDGNSYQVDLDTYQNDDDAIKPDDCFIVNRGGNSYKVSKAVLEEEIGGIGGPEVEPDPGDITSDPGFAEGTGTQEDPYVLDTVYAGPYGVRWAESKETITVVGGNFGEVVNIEVVSGGDRFTQPVQITDANGNWTGKVLL